MFKLLKLILLPNLYLTLYGVTAGGIGLGFGTSKTQSKGKKTTSSERSGRADKTTTTGQTQRQTGTKSTVGEQRSTGTTSKQQSGKQDLSSLISSLDAGTQEQLQDIIKSIGSPSDLKAISGSLSKRALGADAELAKGTQAAVAAAKRRGERAIGQSTTALSKSAGSSQNSLVAQLGLEADTNLQVELAGLESTLNASNRKQSTEELQGALRSQTSSVADISGILKGATQQTTQQTNTTQLSTALQDLLSTSKSTEVQDLLSELLSTSTATQTISEKASGVGRTEGRADNTSFGLAANVAFGGGGG